MPGCGVGPKPAFRGLAGAGLAGAGLAGLAREADLEAEALGIEKND